MEMKGEQTNIFLLFCGFCVSTTPFCKYIWKCHAQYYWGELIYRTESKPIQMEIIPSNGCVIRNDMDDISDINRTSKTIRWQFNFSFYSDQTFNDFVSNGLLLCCHASSNFCQTGALKCMHRMINTPNRFDLFRHR